MSGIETAPALALRRPPAEAVAHLILRVGDSVAARGRALQLLRGLAQPVSFGLSNAPLRLSVGLTALGLQRLSLPPEHQRLLQRLAPAFFAGAPLRGRQLGDSGHSAPAHWHPAFALDVAHLLLSWHGPRTEVVTARDALALLWTELPPAPAAREPAGEAWPLPVGHTLPDPAGGSAGVFFGYRDGLSDVHADDLQPPPTAHDLRVHAPGSLFLGHADDGGQNPFALTTAKFFVREFFHHSSFGALRWMAQDVAAFEAQLQAWVPLFRREFGFDAWDKDRKAYVESDAEVMAFIRAKLAGRWPTGEVLRPGQKRPAPQDWKADFNGDPEGTGCPFGAHVRRLQPRSGERQRPLARRSWPVEDGTHQGLYGQFFCSSLETQFEHLLGQWMAQPPLGTPAPDGAADPLASGTVRPGAALRLPRAGQPDVLLTGLRPWTTTRGTLYAWYPAQRGWQRLLDQDFGNHDGEGPWR